MLYYNNIQQLFIHPFDIYLLRQITICQMLFFAAKDGEALYSQQKQDKEMTVAQIMNTLLPNSDLNWRK